MSAPSSCCTSTCSPEIVAVPGAQGATGAAGTNGSDGINAYSVLTSNITIPVVGGTTASVTVSDNSWMVLNQTVFAGDGTEQGTFTVASKTGSTAIQLTFLGLNGDSAVGNVINSGGQVSPAGQAENLTSVLPSSITNSSLGTGVFALPAGSGIQTLVFHFSATAIANGDLLTTYVPGYKFRILKVDARCAAPVTTGAKAATINMEIGTTDLTGGVISLAGLYAMGAIQAGTAVTANNSGSSADSFSIEASAVTAFAEGAFFIIVSIANLDTCDALASLTVQTNGLITALS